MKARRFPTARNATGKGQRKKRKRKERERRKRKERERRKERKKEGEGTSDPSTSPNRARKVPKATSKSAVYISPRKKLLTVNLSPLDIKKKQLVQDLTSRARRRYLFRSDKNIKKMTPKDKKKKKKSKK